MCISVNSNEIIESKEISNDIKIVVKFDNALTLIVFYGRSFDLMKGDKLWRIYFDALILLYEKG